MKSLILSVVMALVGLTTANAQVVSNNYDSPVTQETKSENNSDEKETFSYIGFGFESFDGFENYGLAMHFLTPNSFGMDINMRAAFKDHGNYNVDLGVNYSFQIWGKDESNLLVSLALGPSLRLQDEVKGVDDHYNLEYKEKFFVDLFINPRATFRYKRFAISAGYFFWAPKFKFKKEDGKQNGFSATLGYSF